MNSMLNTFHRSCLTQRAPDLGYAPRFLDIFLALGVFRFEGESTLPPQAGNAHRWAHRSFVLTPDVNLFLGK